jgi:hypothetical protein
MGTSPNGLCEIVGVWNANAIRSAAKPWSVIYHCVPYVIVWSGRLATRRVLQRAAKFTKCAIVASIDAAGQRQSGFAAIAPHRMTVERHELGIVQTIAEMLLIEPARKELASNAINRVGCVPSAEYLSPAVTVERHVRRHARQRDKKKGIAHSM